MTPPPRHTELCHAPAYALSHDDDAHEPRWVGWIVTAERTEGAHLKRTDDFRADPALAPGDGAKPEDYERSGYDQGHMSDAEDNGWSAEAEHLSFLLSNMIPQCPACNRQTWRYIENWTREETAKHPTLYVLSGPIFGTAPARIGHHGVWVPEAAWKLVLDLDQGEAWGFIVPNDAAHLAKGANITPYVVAPAAIEAATGLKLPLPSAIPRDRSAPMD